MVVATHSFFAAAGSTHSLQFWVFLILFDFHFPFTFH
jgi:hypothetical protein